MKGPRYVQDSISENFQLKKYLKRTDSNSPSCRDYESHLKNLKQIQAKNPSLSINTEQEQRKR